MRRLLFVCALVGCGGGGDDPGPTGDATAQITSYEYKFDIATRAAHAKVTAQLETPGNCVTMSMRSDTAPANIVVDGKPGAPGTTPENNQLKACSEQGHEAGETMTVEVDVVVPMATLGPSQVGYSVRNDAMGNPFHYLVSWVGGCERFGPCDARPSVFAKYTFIVTHPANLDVRCSGTITEVSDTETRCVFDHEGGPTYSTFGVAAYGAWTQIDKGMWGSAKVTLYDRAATQIDAAIVPAYHDGFVKFMESTFGPFPYGNELRVLTAPTYWSGFEHPGNIVLDDGLAGPSSYAKPVAHVLDHEIAHQWAGDQTTLADTYDFVWKEAMAEYLAYVYEDMTEPAVAAKTAAAWKTFSNGSAFHLVPMEKPELFSYYGDVYGPGPMILFRQLEVLAGRPKVIDALKSVLGAPRALSVDEVLAALEAKTGLDLDAYAAAWVRGTGKPQFPRVMATFTAPSTLRVVQTTATDKRCKFSVALKGNAGDTPMLVAVDTFNGGVDQTLTVTPGFTVTSTEIDPLNECLVVPTTFTEPTRTQHPWVSGQ